MTIIYCLLIITAQYTNSWKVLDLIVCLLIEKCTFQPIRLQPRLVSHANIRHFGLDTHQIQQQESTETSMLGVIDSWVWPVWQ